MAAARHVRDQRAGLAPLRCDVGVDGGLAGDDAALGGGAGHGSRQQRRLVVVVGGGGSEGGRRCSRRALAAALAALAAPTVAAAAVAGRRPCIASDGGFGRFAVAAIATGVVVVGCNRGDEGRGARAHRCC